MKKPNKIFAAAKTVLVSATALAFSAISFAAAPSATDTNAAADGATAYIIGILQGEIGYLLALAAFVTGIFAWFKTKDLMATLSCFGLAVAIIIVPGALAGFFN